MSIATTPPPFEVLEEDEEEARRLDEEVRADFAAGRFISWEAVKAWMQSWGKPDELPPPQIGD